MYSDALVGLFKSMMPKPNARLYAFTDDLTQWQLVNLLNYLLEFGASYANIKAWRKLNGLPVDRED